MRRVGLGFLAREGEEEGRDQKLSCGCDRLSHPNHTSEWAARECDWSSREAWVGQRYLEVVTMGTVMKSYQETGV